MSSPHNNLGFLIADVSRLMRRLFQQRLQNSSLTLAQARALFYVSRFEGVRQVDLADALEIQPMTMARLLDQLADNRLIERVPDPRDRRAYQIRLTEAAAPHLAQIQQVAEQIRDEMLADLNDEQARHFIQTLDGIRNKLLRC